MASATISELDILAEVIEASRGNLSPESARALLALGFGQDAVERINGLAEKNRLGTISEEERLLLDKYLRVGNFLNLIHAKARLSLSRNDLAS